MARLLSRGCTGLDVNELQAALNFHLRRPFTPLKPDGIFGPLTDARVREFQTRAKLKADGLVGPKTIAALYRSVGGAVDSTVTPGTPTPARRSFGPVFRQVGPVIPDFVPPSQQRPQARTASSQGFELDSKLVFDPFAKPSKDDKPIKFTTTVLIPWPVFLDEKIQLDVDASNPKPGETQLDGKLKVPFKLNPLPRLELKPYFFVGGGVKQDNYVDLNLGAGGSVKLKLLKNLGGTGVGVSLSADGGVKYKWDREENKGQFKGFLEGGVVIGGEF